MAAMPAWRHQVMIQVHRTDLAPCIELFSDTLQQLDNAPDPFHDYAETPVRIRFPMCKHSEGWPSTRWSIRP